MSKEAAQQLTPFTVLLLLFLCEYLVSALDCHLYRQSSLDSDYPWDHPRLSKDPVAETLHSKTPFVSVLSQYPPHPGHLHQTRVSRS